MPDDFDSSTLALDEPHPPLHLHPRLIRDSLPRGRHEIVAWFYGSTSFEPSRSGKQRFNVPAPAAPTATALQGPARVVEGKVLNLKATVSMPDAGPAGPTAR